MESRNFLNCQERQGCQVGDDMDRRYLNADRSRTLVCFAVASMLAICGINLKARAQTTTADVKPGGDAGSVDQAWGRSSVEKLLPYQSDSQPLGCAGCGGGGGGCASCGGGSG